MTESNLNNIAGIFDYMKSQRFRNVDGVLRIKGKKKGPTLGITVHTHGNEPSGLAAIQFLVEEFRIKQNLLRGILYLVVNNLEATQRYLEAKNDVERRLARKVDVNMNRLPRDLATRTNDHRSEVQRALTLLPIWRTFSVGLDIHSMLLDFPPMIINVCPTLPVKLIRGFPIEIIASNMGNLDMNRSAACGFYGPTPNSIPVLGIETGQHERAEALENAKACVLAILRNLGMIAGRENLAPREYREYFVEDSIIFPDSSFELCDKLCKPFEQFQRTKKGEVLALSDDGKRAFLSPFDGHALLHTQRRRDDITEEAVFLSRPVKKIVV